MVSVGPPTGSTKLALAFSHFMTWASAAIVVGITGYFLNDYAHDQHLIYELTIAAIVLGIWLPSFVVPFLSKYRHWYMPLNFIFSYLWITGFIFSAQDYNRGSCNANAPWWGHCGLKLTNEAFLFIGFFFTLVAFLIDMLAWRDAARIAPSPAHGDKEVRPSADTSV